MTPEQLTRAILASFFDAITPAAIADSLLGLPAFGCSASRASTLYTVTHLRPASSSHSSRLASIICVTRPADTPSMRATSPGSSSYSWEFAQKPSEIEESEIGAHTFY